MGFFCIKRVVVIIKSIESNAGDIDILVYEVEWVSVQKIAMTIVARSLS